MFNTANCISVQYSNDFLLNGRIVYHNPEAGRPVFHLLEKQNHGQQTFSSHTVTEGIAAKPPRIRPPLAK
ncbi:MAG: hypothetical protein KDA87_24840 [Planctomycetales bacterium]|nr:hypothetical protein [Planctomycetales bacterium]